MHATSHSVEKNGKSRGERKKREGVRNAPSLPSHFMRQAWLQTARSTSPSLPAPGVLKQRQRALTLAGSKWSPSFGRVPMRKFHDVPLATSTPGKREIPSSPSAPLLMSGVREKLPHGQRGHSFAHPFYKMKQRFLRPSLR